MGKGEHLSGKTASLFSSPLHGKGAGAVHPPRGEGASSLSLSVFFRQGLAIAAALG